MSFFDVAKTTYMDFFVVNSFLRLRSLTECLSAFNFHLYSGVIWCFRSNFMKFRLNLLIFQFSKRASVMSLDIMKIGGVVAIYQPQLLTNLIFNTHTKRKENIHSICALLASYNLATSLDMSRTHLILKSRYDHTLLLRLF